MDKAAEDLFEKFAIKQQRDLEDLQSVRSYSGIKEFGETITCSSVARALGEDYGLGYSVRTDVLMYAYEESNLHSWLIGDKGLLAYYSKAVSLEKLEQCIQEQHSAVGVEQLQKSRTSNYRNSDLAPFSIRACQRGQNMKKRA